MVGYPSILANDIFCGMCYRLAVGDFTLCAEHRFLLGGTYKPSGDQVCWCVDGAAVLPNFPNRDALQSADTCCVTLGSERWCRALC